MNTRRSTAKREEGGLPNERIPSRVVQVPNVGLEEENEEVLLQEPQVPPEPHVFQVPQVPSIPQGPFVERDMTNAKLRTALINLTQLVTAQDHVLNNHFDCQANQGEWPQPNATTPTSRILDFVRINPPTFHSTKGDEDPQGFID